MNMPGRSGGTYRYGFNGKEKDKNSEWGGLMHYDYGFRIYNPAIGKFLSVDPLTKDYPSWTPYAFAMNRVIDGIDVDGLEWETTKDENGNVTNANFVGYNEDGTAPEGTVRGGSYQGVDGNTVSFDTSLPLEDGSYFGTITTDNPTSIHEKAEIWNEGTVVYDNGESYAHLGLNDYQGGSYSILEPNGSILNPFRSPAIGLTIPTDDPLTSIGPSILKSVLAKAALRMATSKTTISTVQQNRITGNVFRDQVGEVFKSQGKEITKEVYKWTPFGKRFIDLEVSVNGKVLGGVECKFGKYARYGVEQRAKDLYLEKVKGVHRKCYTWRTQLNTGYK